MLPSLCSPLGPCPPSQMEAAASASPFIPLSLLHRSFKPISLASSQCIARRHQSGVPSALLRLRRRKTSISFHSSERTSPSLFCCFDRDYDHREILPPSPATTDAQAGVLGASSLPEWTSGGGSSYDGGVLDAPSSRRFYNRFLNFTRLGNVLNDAAEAFFKSEIRRRLFVTAALIVVSRIGYFIPLPGFDRRLMPDTYLSFAAGSTDELGDLTSELKLSIFQLGLGPQISASILMQVLCHILPSLVKLRKEGLDGHEKIKGYIWWTSLGFSILGAIIVSCYSLQYSIYAASSRVKHVAVTSLLLVLGAMTMTWICDTISESGFGHGSSLIICAGILTGYTDTLFRMLSQFSGSVLSFWPYILAVLGIFTVVTMWAVLVTEGCRKVKLQYYGFKLASAAREGGPPVTEVEPYIPFNINPTGMQPVLTTTYLLAFPGIMASIFGTPFWENLKEILNPGTSIGAKPWVYYIIYAFCVFLFNIFDIANLPKEISDYMTKMGARVPNIKPGKATIEYLTKVQASTRFWGGVLLSILATCSTLLDHYLRHINEGFAVGLTSVLIIVGSIIELRRSYQAYNVMPALSKVLRRYGV